MNIPRRQFLRLATGAAVVPAFLRSAQARPYPSRPVRIVSGFAAGSAGDIILRVMAHGSRNASDKASSSRTGLARPATSGLKLSHAHRRTATHCLSLFHRAPSMPRSMTS